MAPVEANSQLAGAITDFVKKFVAFSPLNSLGNSVGDRTWDELLVGMAAGDDPIFEQYKNHIGPDYWTPSQLFGLVFPQEPVGAHELSVIAWVLPQTEATKKAQARREFFPREPWARAKLPASPRPYSGIHDYCLYFATDGKCGKCIARCPVGALSQAGHDKQRCRQYVVKASTDYIKTAWDLDGDACGLCQARVPCQSLNPTRGLKRRVHKRSQHLNGER